MMRSVYLPTDLRLQPGVAYLVKGGRQLGKTKLARHRHQAENTRFPSNLRQLFTFKSCRAHQNFGSD